MSDEHWGDPWGPSGSTVREDSHPTEQLWAAYARPAEPPPPRGRLGTTALVAALVGALAGGGVGAGVATLVAGDSPTAVLGRGDVSLGQGTSTPRDVAAGSVTAVAAKLLPSVVSIGTGNGSGSGVVISADGYILTNNHVVQGARSVGVTFVNNKELPARTIGLDPDTDLAVVKVDATGLQAAELGRSSGAQVGDPVVAIGSPLGLAGTVTSGIVSALNRRVEGGGAAPTLFNLIQTDAAINPGNSGGALADAGGRVIGINTAIASLGAGSIGLGFAIPIDEARSVADEIIRTGKATHPFLGVNLRTITAELAQQFDGLSEGALIGEVTPGAPADRAGLRSGDVIVELGGTPVKSVDDLIVAIRGHKIGEEVTVVYVRDGQRRTAKAVLAEKP